MHLGIQLWPQNTTWASLRDTGTLVDELGYDSLWTWDHFYTHLGAIEGPNLECWEVLAAWGAVTARVKIGPLVSSVTYRHPAVIAKMAATLDQITDGRAVAGIGAGWFEAEHTAYGIPLGSPAERSVRLAEAAMIIRSLLDTPRTTFTGRHYAIADALAEPKPVQRRLPLLIGGAGERSTLRTAARYADYWHAFGTPEALAPKLEILRRHCAEVGRDPAEIVALAGGWVVISDDRREIDRQLARVSERHRFESKPSYAIAGSVREVAARLSDYERAGFGGYIACFAEPFDTKTIELLAREVRPSL